MKNNFAQEYAKHVELMNTYKTLKETGDTAAIEELRKEARALEDSIAAKGTTYSRLYSKYETAMERGNEFIAWDDVIWDEHVEGFVQGLRNCGIEKFIFSSGWSSAVETAWLLQKNGCKLEGLVEFNGRDNIFGSNEPEKLHGYLFSVEGV